MGIVTAFCLFQPMVLANNDTKPNIVFILADDMGYGDASVYNAESKIKTSHIDALAADGIRFTDAHTAGSTCQPSRYGLMTGRYPLRMKRSYESGLIKPGLTTLASVLKQAGYWTTAIGKWHLGMVGENNPEIDSDLTGGPLDHGFNEYFGIPASLDIPPYYYIEGRRPLALPDEFVDGSAGTAPAPGKPLIQGAFYRGGKMSPGFDHTKVLEVLASRALQTIRDRAGDKTTPFFLYLALPAPHTPWLPSATFREQSGAGDYGDFVLQVDDIVGRVSSALAVLGVADDTMIIFSSDNGPVWYPENVAEFDHDATGELSGMKGDVAEGGHRVPLIVRWPEKIMARRVSDTLINLVDTLATFSDIVGIKLAPGEGLDSISYLPQLLATVPDNRREVAIRAGSGRDSPHYAIRKGDWKLITGKGFGGFTDWYNPALASNNPYEGHLYHLDDDPGEQNNLYAARPEVVVELGNELDTFLAGIRVE